MPVPRQPLVALSSKAGPGRGRFRSRLGALVVVAAAAGVTLMGSPAHAETLPPVDTLYRGFAAGDQCLSYGRTPQGQAQARGDYRIAAAALQLVWLKAPEQAEAKRLYDEYMQPGVTPLLREQLSDPFTLDQFANWSTTQAAYSTLKAQLEGGIASYMPQLEDPSAPATQTLQKAGLGQDLSIDFGQTGLPGEGPTSAPALLAGGMSGLYSQRGHFDDTRGIDGTFSVTPTATNQGVITKAVLKLSAKLRVDDSVDFCPGNILDGPQNDLAPKAMHYALLYMSRLERTPYGDGGWTRPILWRAEAPLSDFTADVTAAYRNDKDGDGVPETEPWNGARFPLDNCPDVANPTQTDSDLDHVGDACDLPSRWFVLPAGKIATVGSTSLFACNTLAWGYELLGGTKVSEQSTAGKASGDCAEKPGPDETIGPFPDQTAFRLYLTDLSCGFTYYTNAEPVDHFTIDPDQTTGAPPYDVRGWDSGGGCGRATVNFNGVVGYNFHAVVGVESAP